MAKRIWPESDDDFIREHYGQLTNGDIAEQLGNCIALQVYRRAIALGLESEPSKTGKSPKGQARAAQSAAKPGKRSRTPVEPELEAMQTVLDALVPLDHDAQRRVFYYVNARLSILKFQPATGGAVHG